MLSSNVRAWSASSTTFAGLDHTSARAPHGRIGGDDLTSDQPVEECGAAQDWGCWRCNGNEDMIASHSSDRCGRGVERG